MEGNLYYAYYSSQLGSGAGQYYVSRYGTQRGRGWVTRLMRWLTPLAGRAARAVGEEIANQGTNVVKDIIAAPSEPIAHIARKRGREGLANLATRAARALSGRGRRKGVRGQTKSDRGRKRVVTLKSAPKRRTVASKKTSVPSIRDIFSPP